MLSWLNCDLYLKLSTIQELLGDSVSHIMKLSAPLKKQYAIEHNLDFERLLDTSQYDFLLSIFIIHIRIINDSGKNW